jgi:hypothetical protein
MTENFSSTDWRKTPPDPANVRDQSDLAFRKASLKSKARPSGTLSAFKILSIASMLLVQIANACTLNLVAPANPSDYTYSMGSGPYSWTLAAYS